MSKTLEERAALEAHQAHADFFGTESFRNPNGKTTLSPAEREHATEQAFMWMRQALPGLGTAPSPSGIMVEWSTRMHKAAGVATVQYGYKIIRLSESLWIRSTPEQRRATVLHELAHHIAGLDAGHGHRWKRAMRSLGEPVARTHSIDTKGLPTRRKYAAKCKCRTHMVGPARAKYIKRGYDNKGRQVVYKCRACATRLEVA